MHTRHRRVAAFTPALCMHAAESAEQSQEEQECNSVPSIIHNRRHNSSGEPHNALHSLSYDMSISEIRQY